ncbi:hypothetical protein [Roseiflexus sp.]|uniref:hypothetical protein n=1 Tax=Roseiflexus sp. TaxID=2562120 RepID=UPI0021DE2127|nr:hypothetical protein [Roseiflexus sp.]GIW02507.1 MAG: hypothetical protein KatS3mg058_3910 [Roseiflexus sp.]
MMRQRTDSHGTLSEQALYEYADLLALRLYRDLGRRCYLLSRQDIIELIHPYTATLDRRDRRALSWLVWNLLQEGAEIEYEIDQA